MRNKAIVAKMRYFLKKILNYTSKMNYDTFRSNSMLVEACVFSLSQIGELAHKVSRDYQEKNPDIPWKKLYGLRNQIVHEYEGVNLIIVWDIISEDLPQLYDRLNLLMESE